MANITENKTQPKREPYKLSGSVENAISGIDTSTPVPASLIVQRLFTIHKEYANNLAGKSKIKDTPGKFPVSEWFTKISALYNLDIIQSTQGYPKDPPP